MTWQQKIQAQREYSEKNREVKRRCQIDERTWPEMQEKQPEKTTKLLCKLIGHKETIDRPIVDNTGSLLTKRNGQLEEWRDLFATVPVVVSHGATG